MFKLTTTSLEVPEKISREERILNIIEANQINVENATLMQLLAKPVVCIERLPLSVIESKHQNLNNKLDLSSSPLNKTNKTVITDIKKIESAVKNKANEVSPRKRQIKVENKGCKKRKTFADINKVNKEFNSILDNDVLQSLSSEEIFKNVEDKLKSCDDSCKILQEKTYNNGTDGSMCAKKSIKIKIQHATGAKTLHMDKPPSPKRMQSIDKSKIHELHPSKEVFNAIDNKKEPFKQTSCSNNNIVINTVDKIINDGSNCGEKNSLTTSQETSGSPSAITLNGTQETENISAIKYNIYKKEKSLTTNRTKKVTNTDEYNIRNNIILTPTVPKTIRSAETINLNHNQDSATRQEINTVTNYNSEKSHLPMTNRGPIMTVRITQPKPTPNPSSSRGNFLLNVTVEQAASTLLPIIKCLISITESNNPEEFCKTAAMISHSLKYYLSKVCIHSFNIHSFINIVTSKLSRQYKSSDLDKKIVNAMFKSLSVITDKPVEKSEFLLRFYAELKKMANDPRYALDPLSLDSPINHAPNMATIDKNRFYDGHSYEPVDNVFLTNVTQIAKTAKSSVKSNCNSRKGTVRNSQTKRLPVSKRCTSKNNLSGQRVGSSQNIDNSAHVSNSMSLEDSYSTVPPLVSINCSSSKSSISTMQTISNQPVVSSTTSSSLSLDNRPVYSVQSEISNARKVLTNCNKIAFSSKPCPPILQHQNYAALQQSTSHYNFKENSYLSNNNNELTHPVMPPSSCTTNVCYPETFSVPPSFNAPSVPYVYCSVSECNTQKQLPSGYNTVYSNGNSIQKQGTFLSPSIPNSTPNLTALLSASNTALGGNTQKQLPFDYNTPTFNNNGVQNRGTFSIPSIPHSTCNPIPLPPTSNTVSESNILKRSLSGYKTATFNNNNNIQKRGTFPVPPVLHSTSNLVPLTPASYTVSGCNSQKQLPSAYNTPTFNNNGYLNGETLSIPPIPRSTSNLISLPPESNTVSESSMLKRSLLGYKTATLNNNNVQKRGTFLAPSVPHSNSNLVPLTPASYTVSGCNTQKQLPCDSNNSVRNGETFSVPPIPRSISNLIPLPPESNTISESSILSRSLSNFKTATFNNNYIQKRGTFPSPSVPHSTSNLATLPSLSYTVSESTILNRCLSNYKTATFNNNNIQKRGTFPTPSIPHSTSNALYLSPVSNTVSGFIAGCQPQQPPGTNNNPNQIRLNNNVISDPPVLPLSNNGTRNHAVLATNVTNVLPTPVHLNNGTKSSSPRELPVTSTATMVPKIVPKHVLTTSSQNETAFISGNELNSTRIETIIGNKRHIPTSHQSLQLMGFQNCITCNTGEKEGGGKGEDDSIASLKSYAMNMNSVLPNNNKNCQGAREFIDIDYYYGNFDHTQKY